MKLAPLRRSGRWLRADPYRLILILLILTWVIVFTREAWSLQAGMRTHKADLGQIDQAIWNTSRGRFVEQTDNGFIATRLTDHVEPILALISPIYWLWDDVRAILLLQVLFVALGALPLYALAVRQFEKLIAPKARAYIWEIDPVHSLTRPLALSIAVAYLLAPQLQSAVLTEFHAAPLAVPFILWAFWAVDAGRWGQFLVAALLTLLVKEEIALLAAGLGLWAIWRGLWDARSSPASKPSHFQLTISNYQLTINNSALLTGATIFLLSLFWFATATFLIVPAHAAALYGATESTYFQRYGALGDTSADIVKSFFTQPQLVWQIATEQARLTYLRNLLAAFAWLPLLGVDVLLLSLPVLLANLLSAYPAQYYGEFHYTAPLVPYFAVAAAYGLGRLWRWAARRLNRSSSGFQHLPAAGAAAMAAAALAQNSRTALRPLLTVGLLVWILGWSFTTYAAYGRGPWGGRYDPVTITAHHEFLARFTAQLPPDAAVTATAAVHPHVSHRRFVYQFPLGLDAPVPAEWALLDVTTNTDMAPGDLKAQVDVLLARDWGVVDGANGFLLLHKGAPEKSIPAAFYSFTEQPAAAAVAQTPLTPDPVQAGIVSNIPGACENPGMSTQPACSPLILTGVTADDWPRWRQTKLTATWSVGSNFTATQHAPRLDVLTPAQESAATLATAAPPALVWRPASQWRPGDQVQVTTLPLQLPRTFAVTGGDRVEEIAAIYRRTEDDQLVALPAELADTVDLPAALNPALLGPLHSATGVFTLPNGAGLALQAWIEDRPTWPGDRLDLWLQWQGEAWPAPLTPFVHLRRNGENVEQQDGAPRWFVPFAADELLGKQGFANDWRQFALPAGSPTDGTWSVVVGLYDPVTGQRVPVTDAAGNIADALVVGAVEVGPAPAPDQACALLPASCNSLSEPRP